MVSSTARDALSPLLRKSPETADVREGWYDDERGGRNNPDTAMPSLRTTFTSRPLRKGLPSFLETVCVAGAQQPWDCNHEGAADLLQNALGVNFMQKDVCVKVSPHEPGEKFCMCLRNVCQKVTASRKHSR